MIEQYYTSTYYGNYLKIFHKFSTYDLDDYIDMQSDDELLTISYEYGYAAKVLAERVYFKESITITNLWKKL